MVVSKEERGRVEAIHTSPGGVPKNYAFVVNVLKDRIEGDDHDDNIHHGGPERAVCLFSSEIIGLLKEEGHPIFPGSTGENLTVSGLKWDEIVPGTRLWVGSVLLEVSGYAAPCKTIRMSFLDGHFSRISHKLFPGWSRVYARVLIPGQIRTAANVIIEARPEA